MLEATGFDKPVGSGARIVDGDGHVARAEVVGFRGNRTLLMALGADAAHASGARVEPDASQLRWSRSAPACSAAWSTRSASRSTASARSPRPTNGRSPASPAIRSTAPA